MIRTGLLRKRWYLLFCAAMFAATLSLAIVSAASSALSETVTSCTEGKRQPVTAGTPLTAYEAPVPPGATVESLPGGGKIYIEHHGETMIETPIPPKGFDPKTASAAELSRYYFPPKPTDPVELEAWDKTFGNLKAPAPPGRCERPVHNQPREQSANSLSTSSEGLSPSRGNENFLWGGYSAIAPEHPHHFGAVTGEYNQPSGRSSECSNDYVASWTGLGGYYEEEPFLQSGTEVGPNNEYLAWWEYYGKHEYENWNGEYEFQVRPGDLIQDYVSHKPGGGPANLGLGMASNSSPGIAGLTNGSYEIAFRANTGYLWTYSPSAGGASTSLGLSSGSSPSIAGLTNGSYEIAFNANSTNNLWVYSPSSGGVDLHLGMAAGTTPSITGLSNGSYEIAFTANTGELWTYSPSTGATPLWLGLSPGSSPSITGLTNGSYEIAFDAKNTNNLWNYSPSTGGTDLHLGMAAGTSPSIGTLSNGNGGYEIAFQANTGYLYTYSPSRTTNTEQGMAAGTSPAIAAQSEVVAFQANTGYLYIYATNGITNTVQGMATGTSPNIALLTGPEGATYKAAFQANTNNLYTYSGETAELWVINHTTGLYGVKVISPASAYYGGGAADFIDEKDASYLRNYNVNSWREAKVFNNVEGRWKGLGGEENRRLSIEVPNKPGYYLSEPSSLSGGTSFNDNWKHCK